MQCALSPLGLARNRCGYRSGDAETARTAGAGSDRQPEKSTRKAAVKETNCRRDGITSQKYSVLKEHVRAHAVKFGRRNPLKTGFLVCLHVYTNVFVFAGL